MTRLSVPASYAARWRDQRPRKIAYLLPLARRVVLAAVRSVVDRHSASQRSISEERSRIARDMHDVVAHGMTVIAVQAAAAQGLAHTDPDKAVEVMARVEGVGRESLTEMQRMLGVLGNGEDEAAVLVPHPTLSDVPVVVAQRARSGMATQLSVSGQERDLPPGITLAAVRIVQEALDNVPGHAGSGTSARVHVDYLPDSVLIEVTDNEGSVKRTMSGGGVCDALIGIRERVRIYGGEFSAGFQPGGKYSVRAVLPVANIRPDVACAAVATGALT
ncbi:MAG: sensor histidine kinase [Acidimicrobiales bacterium]